MTIHKPVLLKEVIEGLDIQVNDVVLDGTVGGGGYLMSICSRLGKEGVLIGLDQDNSALERVQEKLSSKKDLCKIHLVNSNFRNLDSVLKDLNLEKVDKVVFDLGMSSDQLDSSGRGFSFQKDEPLIMSLKKDLSEDDLTASEIVNTWDENNLADIIFGYGEEKFSRGIAKEICEARKNKKIETTFELVEIIERAVPKWYLFKKTHFATKTFQALRITVNDEIESLREGMKKAFEVLNPKGRLAIVSFHSREDRIIKRFFRELKDEKKGVLINKKPIGPSSEEYKENPRSRSAKLRLIEKI
ncbi:16S rRNA (cytosine(1402)-N(4))-methyltransferase RsmH [Patescibacteria group bacterium]|nr:16S rRNA (cytosine(1402)-N(4))-methyltransferase RsmH [Patescibacteria group bacterium]